ncbi:ankyrin [Aulographum hederae CBS 113979]|uniref:Ankyrin n=1 Tax=Aulographum hederae CBS 113979 TaxID=1176131 RepID=A0A6G1GNU8_9PEZI|nr:ankyrin [Aulographum hederae CBS 113979]
MQCQLAPFFRSPAREICTPPFVCGVGCKLCKGSPKAHCSGSSWQWTIGICRPRSGQTMGSQADVKDACAANDLERIQQILPNHSNKYSLHNSLVLAQDNGHSIIEEYLLSNGAQPHPAFLAKAAHKKDWQMVRVLLKYRNVNSTTELSRTPPLALLLENEELVSEMLAQGADPNASYMGGFTPLSVAVSSAPSSVVKLLLDNRGSVNHGDLLHYAANGPADRRLELVSLLLERGAAVNKIMYQDSPDLFCQREMFGLGAPIHAAAAAGDLPVVQYLLDHGADSLLRDSLGRVPAQVAELWQYQEVKECLERAKLNPAEAERNFIAEHQWSDGQAQREVEGAKVAGLSPEVYCERVAKNRAEIMRLV